MGRIVPETDNPNSRELVFCFYRLIYKVSPSGVEVLTLIHTKQELKKEKFKK